MCIRDRTSREAGTICVVSIPVSSWNTSRRVRTVITISSSEALPARSPRPLMVHSTCRAPASTAANELATASPRSLWQWTETVSYTHLDVYKRQRRDMVAQVQLTRNAVGGQGGASQTVVGTAHITLGGTFAAFLYSHVQ